MCLAAAITLSGLGIVIMILIAPPPANYSYYAGLILVLIFGYVFLRIRFIWAAVAGWTIVAFYEIASIWLTATPMEVLLNNNFFILSANVIGMFACYSSEYYSRRDFYLVKLLEIEQERSSPPPRAGGSGCMRGHRSSCARTRNSSGRWRPTGGLRKRRRASRTSSTGTEDGGHRTLAGSIAHDFNNILSPSSAT